MYALGIHLGSLTTQAIYVDQTGCTGVLTDLEESRGYPIPSWIALDDLGSLVGHAALRLQHSDAPPTLIRFAREMLLTDAPASPVVEPAGTPDEAGLMLLGKILRDLPTLRRDDLSIALTAPDGVSAERKQYIREAWSKEYGVRNLCLLEDSLAVLTAAGSRQPVNSETVLSLIFDEDALRMTVLHRQAQGFAVASHQVISAISLLAVRDHLAESIRQDAGLLFNGFPGQGGVEPAELENYWYSHGEAFINYCAAPEHTPPARELIIRCGNRYLTPVFTPGALADCLDGMRQILVNRLLELAHRQPGDWIGAVFCTGKLGALLNAAGIAQNALKMPPQTTVSCPSEALAQGAALYAARLGA